MRAVTEKRPPELGLQRHYTPPQLAELWGVDASTIRRWFESEPGVLAWGTTVNSRRRRHLSLRIPESVALRVHEKMRIRRIGVQQPEQRGAAFG
jgi:hypothetical protein